MMYARAETNSLCNALTIGMMDDFITSPIECTEEFEKQWMERHTNAPINDLLQIKSTDEKTFFETYADADTAVLTAFRRCFIFMDQRSPEWLIALNKFVCGNNSANIGTAFQSKYNLIRGAVIELLVMQLLSDSVLGDLGFEGYQKYTLGFIVDENVPGSRGFAPDLVLIGRTALGIFELVLIEIKGLKSLRRNSDYYRGLELATKQIHSGRKILSKHVSHEQLIIQRGVVALCSIENNRLSLETHVSTLM